MNDINKIIENLYNAYLKKDLQLMKSLIDEGKIIDPNNSYIKKYETLYNDLNSGNENKAKNDEQIIQFQGKTIKCTHCGANIGFSEYNKKVIEDFKNGISKELIFKCNYCKTEFKWSAKGFSGFYLNISVGQEITLEGKKYRVSGAVKYDGSWQTNNSGKLEYIEWILVDTSGDTYYLSESKAHWREDGESGIEYETELSRKIIPDFNIGGLDENKIIINEKEYRIREICKTKVVENYGENSKSYTIGEEVVTFQLNFNGKEYVFEKEKTSTQEEIGVYHTWKINDNALKKKNITSKDYSKVNSGSIWWLIITGVIVFFISYSIFNNEKEIRTLSSNELANENLEDARGLYKINFSEIYKKDISETTSRYDYGGIEHTIKYLNGIKFKVETQEDLDVLKEILDGNIDINSFQTPGSDVNIDLETFSNYFKDNQIINFK